jgi:hypothetical protein
VNKSHLWLLEVVYFHHQSISRLLPDPDYDYQGWDDYAIAFNRESHHLSEEELADALLYLFREGLIQGRRFATNDYSID